MRRRVNHENKKSLAVAAEHNVIDFLPGFISLLVGFKMEPKSLLNCNNFFNFSKKSGDNFFLISLLILRVLYKLWTGNCFCFDLQKWQNNSRFANHTKKWLSNFGLIVDVNGSKTKKYFVKSKMHKNSNATPKKWSKSGQKVG